MFSLPLPAPDNQDHNLLVSELQSLIVESKRRHSEVKDVSHSREFSDIKASEAALEILRPGPQPREVLARTFLQAVQWTGD